MSGLRVGPFDQFAPERGRRRWPVVLLAAGITLMVVLAGLGFWIQRQVNPSGGPGRPVQVTVAKGMTTSDIANLLDKHGVIANATVFRYYSRLNGMGSIQAGDYTFRRRQHMSDVIDVLEKGAQRELDRVTVPEGLTVKEIAERVGKLPGRSTERFLELSRNGSVRSSIQPPGTTNVEGLLLPETYFVSPEDDEAKILTRMVDSFDELANRLDLRGAAQRLGVSPYDVVIVASMVEREARVPEDRGPVARVIYNRLARGMPLQIDATIQFALGRQRERLLNKDLEVDSPYNTYKITGLPPGPIASPGRAALEAAMAPPEGPWLYYVLADANGKHAFTDSAAEFNRLKAAAESKGLL